MNFKILILETSKQASLHPVLPACRVGASCVPAAAVLIQLPVSGQERQWRMATCLSPSTYRADLAFLTDAALAAAAMWGVNSLMEAVCMVQHQSLGWHLGRCSPPPHPIPAET